FLSSFAMYIEEGQPWCAGAVQPVQLPFHPKAAFVTMDDICLPQLAVNLAQRRFTASCHRLTGLSHKSPGRRMTIEVAQHFTGAGNRKEVVVVQVAGLCLEAQAILDWLAYTGRKCRPDAPLALTAILDLGSMFGHFDLDRWHVVYLAADIVVDYHTRQVVRTVRAMGQAVRFKVVGLCSHF